ncbi:MAG: NYN domain-containing protein [Akkermansia sp.]
MLLINRSGEKPQNNLYALSSSSSNIWNIYETEGFFFCKTMIKTAILVDGAYYRKRAKNSRGPETPQEAASTLYKYCQKHIRFGCREECFLYRVLYYDCPPSAKTVYNPITRKSVNLKKDPLYQWSTDFLNELKSKRKFALRLGVLSEEQLVYNIRPEVTKKLLSKTMTVDDLTKQDLYLSVQQKGVDMRIGIDIVSMALKKQVDKIILISGDSDFVPAAKLARREGIDFILDPMWATIKPQLNEHIDGLKSFSNKKEVEQDVEQDVE